MELTVNVPDKKVIFFIELVRNLGFKVEKQTEKMTEKEFLDGLKESFEEVRRYEKGEIDLPNAKDILNEL